MELETKDEGKFHIIKVIGDLDASSSLKLDDAIQNALNAGKTKLIFDCETLNYISSPGIGVFTSRIEDHSKGNLTMVVFGMNEKVLNVFKILGLEKLLPIFKSLEEAKQFIDGPSNKGKLL